MRYIISESQWRKFAENFDDVLDLYSKLSRGEQLKPSEKDVLTVFNKYVKKGGTPEEFVFNPDDVFEIDPREGELFKYSLKGKPFVFEYSETVEHDNQNIEYAGGVTYDGQEYFGSILTDKFGYIIAYEFYNTEEGDNINLEDKLANENNSSEIENYFQEEVIKSLKN